MRTTPVERDGYVGGAFYGFQDHPDLDPARHAAAFIAAGLPVRDPAAGSRYLELGCGAGFSLAALAAAHPNGRFTGVDLDETHVAALRRLVDDAGLANLQAICSDFAGAAVREQGVFDTVAAHGVWSWVSPRAREAIVALLSDRLADHGVFYLSYNCLPGMAALEPIRQLLQLGVGRGRTTLERVRQAIAFLRDVDAANAAYLTEPCVRDRLTEVLAAEPAYVAHEYFNAHWTSFYHTEIAAELEQAGLVYCCSSRVVNDMSEALLDARQRKLIERLPGAAQRQVLRDFLSNRTFRTDLFVRGRRTASRQAREARLATTRFAAVKPAEALPANAPDSYRRIVDALCDGPLTHADLIRREGDRGRNAGDLHAPVLHLLGMELIGLALPDAGMAERAASTSRFNAAVLGRAASGEYLPGLASPVTGGVLPLAPEHLAALVETKCATSALPAGLARLCRSLRIPE